MSDSKDKKSIKAPEKVELALPPVYRGNGSYTVIPKGGRDVQFVLPGTRRNPVETLRVNSTAIQQPFTNPAVLSTWRGKS
ncbi:hypothetical protein CCHL11_08377 [Colletotrichum chlorophyti]|uniref:Uncharacterized protein n=1 Tax=Colletotrichum chlorophyti TaxID=708187 RepID=A0A1Q8REZ4_9PEZI|nr:hypothetical protein CCHL11_08377 [Colletotrichum chlorophyti]